MRKKLKRSTKQYIIVSTICFVVIGTTSIIALNTIKEQVKSTYIGELNLAYKEINSNKKMAYVVKEELSVGEIITRNNTEYIEVSSSLSEDLFVQKGDLGKTLLLKVGEGTHLLKSMVTDIEIDKNIREVFFDVIEISNNINDNDVVDVRIQFPNGEDYIILSKKHIKSISESKVECYFWLTEEEILQMSSGIVDAFLYEGTKLYMTKYIEPNLQESSIVFYTPSSAILTLLKKDPNIEKLASNYLTLQLRSKLENRLAKEDGIPNTTNSQQNSSQGNNIETSYNEGSTIEEDYFLTKEEEYLVEDLIEYGQ